MAFVLAKKRIVKDWPVTINVPVDGGTTAEQLCSATFEILDQTEYNKLMNDDIAFCCRVVTDFGHDIQHEDGSPMPCTPDNKKALFASAGFVRLGFINAYHEASAGMASKNSKGSQSTLPAARKRPKQK